MKVIFRKQITPSGVIFIKIYPEYRNNAGQVRLELEPQYTMQQRVQFASLDLILDETVPVNEKELMELKHRYSPKDTEIVIPCKK